ncbi:MAG: bifunctional UDP-N-acetylglucosamine diphosphorylase/glucosamine-1-phosphate N-acetyltransferase GlmU [Alphaproteobacteria bacterium]
MSNNHKHKFAAVILAAGKGTRMKSSLPKVMHKLAGWSLITHVLRSVQSLQPERAVVVVAPGMADVEATVKHTFSACDTAVQDKQMGTGHAVSCTKGTLGNYDGTVLVLYGDTPLITPETLQDMLDTSLSADVVVLGMQLDDPTGYGRLIIDSHEQLKEIIEHKDATEEQRSITLCNSGIMAVKAHVLFELLAQLDTRNAAGEYYLTDIVSKANERELRCRVAIAENTELLGINDRIQLAEAEAELQDRLCRNAMENGATLIDPPSTFLCADTKLGQDVVIHPHVVFGPGVVVEDGAEIRSFSHIEGTHLKKNAIVGPFARLRPGSVLEEGARVGNFVELKKAHLGEGAKVNHLSYVGDSEVGADANIGAGTITCNYDGISKHKTTIGAGAFIGSNTALVAPVSVGAGAIIGAGSVITRDVEAGALALTRSEQINKPGIADKLRNKQKKSG